jgi:hypothetical protein
VSQPFVSLGIALIAASVAGQALARSAQPPLTGATAVSHSQHIPIHHRRTHGVSIVHSVDHAVTAPLDITTGHATGRRQHKPIVLTAGGGPRSSHNAYTGLTTGRRMHKP